MSKNSALRQAVRLALLSGASSLGVGALSSAYAQDAPEADQIEEITVTGSRIKRADLDSASPVTVLQRDAILATGITDVGNIIQKMPSMSGSPIGTTTNNGGNGSVQIDLRGMGPDRTLTLVNGQRVVDGGDYQTIPSTMIERVEILKDGASAVYGADAVAGVVNIITRRDFDGIEVNAQTADFFDMKSGAQHSIGLIAGKQFDRGNFVFGAEFVDQEHAFQSDAPWDFFQDSYYIYPTGCENQVAAPFDGTATGGCYPIGSSRIPESRLSFMNQGLFMVGSPASAPYEAGLMAPHDGRTYNYAPVNYIQTPYTRTNLFAEGHFDLSETVRFNAEIRGNLRESEQFLAPLPFTGGDPMYRGNFNGTPYEGVSEDNYYLRQAVDLYNATNNPAQPLVYEPLVTPRRRMIETNRRFEQDVQQFQVVAGLEGSFNEIDWDVFYNKGYRQRIDHDFGQFSGVRLFNALGPSADLDNDGRPECYSDINDPSTLIEGCVPLNLFGGGSVNAAGQPTVTSLTQDMINYVKLDTVDTFITNQDIAGFGLSGEVFDLPAGSIGWAAGYSYWKQDFEYTPDSAKTIGAVTGNVGAGTNGSLTNNSVYGEFLVPIMDNGVQTLNLKGGVRYDDYDAFDGDTTWQVGAEFRAIDSLKFRGTAGTVFRAPTISNLFGGLVDSFPTYTDPCIPEPGESLPPGCAQVGIQTDSQLLAQVGGNPDLKPESGETFTAGIVWTPDIFGANADTSMTLDYWQVDIEEGISSLGVQFILDDCYIAQNPASCALVTRTPTYDIDNVIDTSLNVAEQGARGVDFEARYSLDTDIGQWELALLWSHLIERTKTPFPGADEEELQGRYTNVTGQDGGAYAEDKINYSVQWQRNDLSVGYMGEYISELDTVAVIFSDYHYKVDSQLYHDLFVNYEFDFGTRISAGVTNLTDEAPPYIDLGFNAKTDPPTYRQFGRGYYVRLVQSFE
ncbi:MAG: TonB-dependent receptor [Woeseia sp.]